MAEQMETAVAALGNTEQGSVPVTGVVRMTAADGFSAYIASPAMAKPRRRHPGGGGSVEIVTITRQALQYRLGLGIGGVVGEPRVHRAEAMTLGDYGLGLDASSDWLAVRGALASVDELSDHRGVYLVDWD